MLFSCFHCGILNEYDGYGTVGLEKPVTKMLNQFALCVLWIRVCAPWWYYILEVLKSNCWWVPIYNRYVKLLIDNRRDVATCFGGSYMRIREIQVFTSSTKGRWILCDQSGGDPNILCSCWYCTLDNSPWQTAFWKSVAAVLHFILPFLYVCIFLCVFNALHQLHS